MGGEEFSERYRDKLEQDLEETFGNFKSHNESKNIFKAARTPAVFFGIAVLMYMLSGIFGLFGIYTLANSSNLLMGISLLTLALWAYIRYSGELSDFGSQLDAVADYLWENVSLGRLVKWMAYLMWRMSRRVIEWSVRRRMRGGPRVCPLREAALMGRTVSRVRRKGARSLSVDSGRRRIRGLAGGAGSNNKMKMENMTPKKTY